MRWQFIDPNNQEEVAARHDVLLRIDAWWKEFQSKTKDLSDLFSRKVQWDLPAWMTSHLEAVHPELLWEFGPALNSKGHRLVITPESNHHLRPLVRAILKQAPEIEGWEFYEYRLSEDAETACSTVNARTGKDISGFQVRVSRTELNQIDLTFTAPSITSEEDRDAFNSAFIATECLVGEQVLNQWIGRINTIPFPVNKGITGLFSTKPKELQHFVDLARLPDTVTSLINSMKEQLPPSPHFEQLPDATWVMWEFEPQRSDADYAEQEDLFFGMSMNRNQWIAAHNRNLFFSDRYSRLGETFCYVKIDRSEGFGDDGFSDREEIVEALNSVLVSRQLGCCTGGGSGYQYSYIDFALIDLESGIQAIRQRLQIGNISKRSWIQFYDADLTTEWVGIYDDTPPPPMPE